MWDADIPQLAILIDSRELIRFFFLTVFPQMLIALNHPGGFVIDVGQGCRVKPARNLECVQFHDPLDVRRSIQRTGRQRLNLALDGACDSGASVGQQDVQLSLIHI